jgi:hypothetical protein
MPVRFRVTVVLALLVPGCLGSTTAPPQGPVTGRAVLFIGNSLTYYNDMPSMIAAFAEAEAQEPLVIGSVAVPNYSLEDHWADGRARAQILRGGWKVVVLQQGPSSLPESQVNLAEWSGRFAVDIRAIDARPALYMVWPEATRQEAFDAVSESYRAAAVQANGLLFPVGEAWLAAWRRDPAAPLYGPDQFHPSVEGSYLAALVMYQQLYDRSPVGLPFRIPMAGGTVSIDSTLAHTLQEAAAEANAQFARQ